MAEKGTIPFPMNLGLLTPGLRLALGVSGGADSVALLRVLADRARELGLAVHVAHLHHGLRGDEADGDLEFVRALADSLGLPFHQARVDARAEAEAAKESIEEAARRLRYDWFRHLMRTVPLDAVATAHTLDDQAETVCAKFLRGAWTEGLSGIHPVVVWPEGRIVRPILSATRGQVEAYLTGIGQRWREDSSNQDRSFTRNRIRHELLPRLEAWNPRMKEHLAAMAELARDDEAWWQAEVDRIAPQLLLEGRPARGGGRAAGDSGTIAIDITRLAALAPALQRRLLRLAAERVAANAEPGAALGFAATASLLEFALRGKVGKRLELPGRLLAQRTARELRIGLGADAAAWAATILQQRFAQTSKPTESTQTDRQSELESRTGVMVPIPGEVVSEIFALRLRIAISTGKISGSAGGAALPATATLRNWRPGDRVTLRYSSGPKKVKEVLERLRVTGSSRALWPVLEWDGTIVWMRGVELEPVPGLSLEVSLLPTGEGRIAEAPEGWR